VEQSGLPLERGRAYRGYVWATSTTLSADAAANADAATGDGSEENDGVAMVLEARDGTRAARAQGLKRLSALRSRFPDHCVLPSSLRLLPASSRRPQVWLRHPGRPAQKDRLLARVTDSALLAGLHQPTTAPGLAAHAAGGSGNADAAASDTAHAAAAPAAAAGNGPANVFGEGYRGARVMATGGAWRRFDFGYKGNHSLFSLPACAPF
jgi:hypothetical protein